MNKARCSFKSLPLTKENMFLDVEIYYSLGGHNYFTGRNESRGYYLSVSPVTRAGNMVSYTGFTGSKQLVLEVSRKSNAAANKAIDKAEGMENQLIDYVLKKNGYSLKETA